ncbi:12094_t:CDS:2, partial [Gigaspora rosea]
PDEEVDIVCQLIYYNPTGYHSNARKLYKAIKDEGYHFPYKKFPPPKHITRASYGRISRPNCVHQADIMFLTHDKYKGKTYKAVLNIVDCASRYKASVPLMSKKSSEVTKAFKKIYNSYNYLLTWPRLLQIDNGREWMGDTSRIMEEHGVVIRVIGPYSHRGTAIVERFNKTLAEILYKVQYAVESITSNPKLIRAWVKHLPKVIDYLNNYPTHLIRAPGSSKWGLAPNEAIKLEKVESRSSTKYKRPVGKNEENKLKKGDTVRYLLANAEWEGGMENQKRATDPV